MMKKTRFAMVLVLLFSMVLGAMPVQAAPFNKVYIIQKEFTVQPSVPATVMVKVQNDHADKITNLQVMPAGVLGVSIIDKASMETSIEAGSSIIMHLQITADEAFAGTADNVISFAFTYDLNNVSQPAETSTLQITVLDKAASTPPPTETPDIRMTAPSSYVSMEAGKLKTVDVTLQNVSAFTATDVQVFPVANKDFKITVSDARSFSLSGRGQKSFKIDVTPDKSVAAGDYTIALEYTYMNNAKVITTGRAEIFVKVVASTAETVVVLSDFKTNPVSITAGDSFALGMKVKNLSAQQASSLKVVLTGLDSAGIYISNATTSRTIGTMAGNTEQTLEYALRTNESMRSGSYAVTLELSYKDVSGQTVTESYPYYISVRAKAGAVEDGKRASLEITSITRPTAAFAVGQDIKINVTIKNSGDATAKNVKVTASPEAVILPQTANIQMVNKLVPGESKTLSFTFAATAAAQNQNYNIGFTVDYETGEESQTDSFMQYVGVTVSNPDAEDGTDPGKVKGTPKIIVSKYTVNPLIVMAGEEFDLDITYMNTHSSKGVYNIKVSASVLGTGTDKGNVFTPVDSSNTFYIDSIAPKGEAQQHLRMYTVPDALPKNYILTITFEYEDEDGTQFNATEEIGVNVQQNARLELGDVYMPLDVFLNESVFVSFTLQNRGKVTLSNLKIKMEGEGIEAPNSEVIFGNFLPGGYDYYDGSFFPTVEGPQEVRIVITYDNDMMVPVEIIEKYTINVMPGYDFGGEYPGGDFPGGEYPGGGMEEQKEGIWTKIVNFVKTPTVWIGVGIGAVVVGLAIGIPALVIRARRKKEGFDLDE